MSEASPTPDALEAAAAGLLRKLRIGGIGLAAACVSGSHTLMPEEVALLARGRQHARAAEPPDAGSRAGGGLAISAARRNEFAAGRVCARRALHLAGGPKTAIGRGALGEPLWPAGFAGSIAHDGGYACALAYPSASGLVWLSIDLVAGPDRSGYLDALSSICGPDEAWLSLTDAVRAAEIFSAKEAAAKILMPLWQRPVALADLEVSPTGRTRKGSFQVTERGSGTTIEIAQGGQVDFLVTIAYSETCFRARA